MYLEKFANFELRHGKDIKQFPDREREEGGGLKIKYVPFGNAIVSE